VHCPVFCSNRWMLDGAFRRSPRWPTVVCTGQRCNMQGCVHRNGAKHQKFAAARWERCRCVTVDILRRRLTDLFSADKDEALGCLVQLTETGMPQDRPARVSVRTLTWGHNWYEDGEGADGRGQRPGPRIVSHVSGSLSRGNWE